MKDLFETTLKGVLVPEDNNAGNSEETWDLRKAAQDLVDSVRSNIEQLERDQAQEAVEFFDNVRKCEAGQMSYTELREALKGITFTGEPTREDMERTLAHLNKGVERFDGLSEPESYIDKDTVIVLPQNMAIDRMESLPNGGLKLHIKRKKYEGVDAAALMKEQELARMIGTEKCSGPAFDPIRSYLDAVSSHHAIPDDGAIAGRSISIRQKEQLFREYVEIVKKEWHPDAMSVGPRALTSLEMDRVHYEARKRLEEYVAGLCPRNLRLDKTGQLDMMRYVESPRCFGKFVLDNPELMKELLGTGKAMAETKIDPSSTATIFKPLSPDEVVRFFECDDGDRQDE